MGGSYRVGLESIEDRLDATFYLPLLMRNETRLLDCGVGSRPLREFVSKGRRVIYMSTKTVDSESAPPDWIPWVTSSDLAEDGFFLSIDTATRVSPRFATKYSHGRLRAGELLVKVKGPNQLAAFAPTLPDGETVLVSGTIWGGVVRLQRIDPWYLTTVLEAPYGRIARARRRTNLNVEFVAPSDLVGIEIPEPHVDAQSYIGNKVRQAEVLRLQARALSVEIDNALGNIVPGHPQRAMPWNRISVDVLGDRLDPRPYRAHRLALREAIADKRHNNIGTVADIQGGNPVPSSEFASGGIPLVKNGDILSHGFADPPATCVSTRYHREQARYAARGGMVVVCLDGEIRAQFFLDCELPAHVNQRVAMLSGTSIRPELLTAWINHPCIQEQLLQWSVQTTVEHISNRILGNVLIPRLSVSKEEQLADRVLWSRTAIWLARQLTCAARFLVEAMIDRKVTEAELVAAHKDPAADRALLERLSADGLDIAGADPLFPDLDKLEELLKEAQQGTDE